MRNFRSNIILFLFALLIVGFNLSANGATTGEFGSSIGAIVKELNLAEPASLTSKSASEPPLLQPLFATPQSLAVINLTDIMGMYELVSCHVNFSDGSKFDCNQTTFSGDMAITPNNTMWQRISLSGVQPIVASGIFNLKNNTITLVNDLVVSTSVLPLTMDGDILTTKITTFEFTETDIWRKIMGPSAPDTVNLSGTVKTVQGSDLCAMVLASGKFTFTCNPIGVFSLTDLTRESDGTVKRQIYASGYFPKIDVIADSSSEAVVMTPSGVCPSYNTPYGPAFVPGSSGRRINISGRVLKQNTQTPVCAMVLANGQHAFSCNGTGSYSLNIPLDTKGQFSLQVYAGGYAPLIQTFDEFNPFSNARLALATECQ